MTRLCLILLFASTLRAQSADSVLLSPTRILQVNIDNQGNLLVAGQTTGGSTVVFRYAQSVQSFSQPLYAGTQPVALTSDSQGFLYLASGSRILRLTDRPPDTWAPQLPDTYLVDAIAFDPQNNPIVTITGLNPSGTTGNPPGRVLKLDRSTGQILANIELGAGAVPAAVTVDAQGAVYLAGEVNLQGFAAKFDPTLQQQIYWVTLDPAMPHGIAVDPAGNAYVAETPLEVLTFAPGGGGPIAFGANKVLKLDPTGAIVASNNGGGAAIALDANGHLIVTGGSYPATGAFQTACGPRTDLGGLSVTLLDPITLQPKASAYLAQQNFLGASALLPDGSLYVATTGNRVLHVNPAAGSSPIACIANGASFLVENSVVPGQLVTIFGRGLGTDPLSVYNDAQQLPFSSNGTEVHMGGYPAALLAVDSGQINAIAPYEISQLDASQPVAVEVWRNGSIIYTWQMKVGVPKPTPLLHFDSAGALDIFQAPDDQDVLATSPAPLADVLNEDGSPNSAANPARSGSTVTIFATGFGELNGSPGDGQPGGNPAQGPVGAGVSVVTPYGSLPLSSVTTVAGRSNAVLQVQAQIPTFPDGVLPPQLPFVIGLTVPNRPAWTNFLYVAR